MNLYKLLIGGFVFSFSVLVNAQDTPKTESLKTAKEVIDRFISVVGTSATSFQNKQTVSVSIFKTFQSKKIEVIDLNNVTIASIEFSTLTNNISRTLLTKEKSYLFIEDGSISEYPPSLSPDMLKKVDYTIFSNETTLLPVKEEFDGEEVYVLLYEERNQNMKELINKTYLYFSVNTGLHIGSKMLGNSSVVYSYIKDYRLVDNKYLLPHMFINSNDGNKTTSVIKYNVDIEQFKNEIFKYPEAAIAAIPNELTFSVFIDLVKIEQNKNPRPEYKDWPCYYIEGKPETWNLEKHISGGEAVGGKGVLKLNIDYTHGIRFSLEGASAGVVIKNSDAFAFLVRKGNQYAKDSTILVDVYTDKTGVMEKLYKEKQQELIEQYKLKLYQVKSEKNERVFVDNKVKQIPCKVEKLPYNIEKISPLKKLAKGEYVFYYNLSAFTFRVED